MHDELHVQTMGTGASKLLLAPERGRVLQVHTAGHPAFWADSTAPGWNVGGDRLWFGPEVAWFWTSRSSTDASMHQVPEAIDPGNWQSEKNDTTCRMWMTTKLRHRHTGTNLALTVERVVTVERVEERRVDYTTVTTVNLDEAPEDQALSAWSLLQVPPGGWLLIVTRVPPERPRNYFEPVDDDHLSLTADGAWLLISGRRRYKLGLAADVATGRTIYTRPVAGGRLAIERNASVAPGGAYCDLPLDETSGTDGDAVQVYNDSGRFGGFGEIEHHSPSLTSGGSSAVTDVCHTSVRFVPEDA